LSDELDEVGGVEEDDEPDMSDDKNPLPLALLAECFGPQIRTVPSSLQDASML
jgi:hypothetical protein